MTPREWAILVALSALWGGSFFFAKVALADIPPLTLTFGRVAIAAAVLLLVAAPSIRAAQLSRTHAIALLVMGLLNNALPFSLIFWAQQTIPVGLASILNATTPFFTIVVAHAFTADEKASPGKLAGIVCGITGVAVLNGPSLFSNGAGIPLAVLACLGAALSYGLAGVYGRRFRELPPIVPAAGQLAASTILLAPVSMLVEQPWTLDAPSLQSIAALCALALASTALAYVLYFRLLATAGATNLLLVTMLIPVSAVILGALFLDERLQAREFAGMAIITAGLLVVDRRLLTIWHKRV